MITDRQGGATDDSGEASDRHIEHAEDRHEGQKEDQPARSGPEELRESRFDARPLEPAGCDTPGPRAHAERDKEQNQYAEHAGGVGGNQRYQRR